MAAARIFRTPAWCLPWFALLVVCSGDGTQDPGNDTRVTFAATVYGDGEGAGFLRVLPEGAPLVEWAPHDVVIVRDAPLDLSVVAALISAGPQSGASHLSLRLKEKDVPNASVPEIYRSKELAAWNGKLVHVRMQATTVEIAPTTMEEAERLWARKRPVVGPLSLDLQRRDWASFAELRHKDAPAFGAKAANLGELYQILPTANRVDGFGMPASVYEDFIQQSNLAPEVARLIADRRVASDPAWKKERLQSMRKLITMAAVPAALLRQLVDTATARFGTDVVNRRLRFRSSTNAEDLEAFSGAGLYESRSGCLADDLDDDEQGPSRCLDESLRARLELELADWKARRAQEPTHLWIDEVIDDLQSDLTEEKTAASALKKVWASLWNDRAYDERDFYALDHAQVKMAVAVLLAEKGEQVESVAFTNVRYQQTPPFYVLVSQRGEIGVVRPIDPSARSETRLFYRGANDEIRDDVVLSPSSLATGGASLWTPERLRELAKLLFVVQDHFQANVYPARSPLALDIELKITSDNRLLIKQARPYLSGLPPL